MSKGMAIVSFHRPEDAYIARQKYNRKIIDGRRPIMIEIIKDEDQTQVAPLQAPNRPPSLLERLGGVLPLGNGTVPAPVPSQQHPKVQPVAAKAGGMTTIAARKQHQAAQRMQGVAAHPAHQVAAAPRQKVRAKKGPKRLKKTLEQLDSEMDDYRARTDDPAAMKVS
ncbi:hypothetical protein EUX98_g5220 [Antrodiella citrinella]|uniref:Chromatin target of PRMT1 protein C-terminal domain-containing protein n=1 Tax=Antrodiella citrinella TaxID=2447956 RepID=A0A4S4MZV4_9APHY|nr:hypothetical protein EUX98_g5220 [Antrodiella citrinella]